MRLLAQKLQSGEYHLGDLRKINDDEEHPVERREKEKKVHAEEKKRKKYKNKVR